MSGCGGERSARIADVASVGWLRRALVIATVACFSAGLAPQPAAADEALEQPRPRDWTYTITIHPTEPNTAQAALTLPAESGGQRRLVSRAADVQARSQVSNVGCDGAPLEMAGEGAWVLPSECRVAHWDAAFDLAGPQGVQASDQQSVAFSTGWWLFSGPASLLRLEPEPEPPLRVHLSAPGMADRVATVPSVREPPSFFVLGEAPAFRVSAGPYRLTYVADDIDAVLSHIDPNRHADAIDYLAAVIGEVVGRPSRNLTVVWLTVPRERQDMGGAAGHDTLLVNYVADGAGSAPEAFFMPFVIVLHEQFHQIDGGSHPVWVSESLAHYYALKAASLVFPEEPAIERVRDIFIDADRPVVVGLLGVQSEIERGVFDNYGLFYSQGASFWAEIDTALSQATDGERDLDDILATVLAAEFPADGALPIEVIEALADLDGGDLERLVRTYLDGPV